MKTSHILLFVLCLGGYLPLLGQLSLPNPGFEQWQADTGFAVFESYFHLNAYHDLTYGMTQVSAVPSPGGTAVRLEVGLSDEGDTLNTYLRLGQQCDGGLGGGMNLTEQPDSLIAWIRHDIPATDHANLILIYESNGGMVDFSYCAISGTQNNFYRFACALNAPAAGSFDQISLEIKPGSGDQPIPGGWLEVDSIALIGTTTQFPNPGFEVVHPLQWANPIDWASPNQLLQYLSGVSAISPTTDAYEGNLAVQLESVEFMVNCDTDSFGFLVDGSWAGTEEPNSGIPFTPTQATFCFGGFYRYLPQGTDTAAAALLFTKFDPMTQTRDTLHEEGIALPPAESYTRFEFCLDTADWDVQPDSFIVAFLSSDADHFFSEATPGIGSRLLLDALYFQDEPSTGVEAALLLTEIHVYPNPVVDQLTIRSQTASPQPLLVEILDLQGRRVYQGAHLQQEFQIPLSHLTGGFYLVSVLHQEDGRSFRRKIFKR